MALACCYEAETRLFQSMSNGGLLDEEIKIREFTYMKRPGFKHGKEKSYSPIRHLWAGFSEGHGLGFTPASLKLVFSHHQKLGYHAVMEYVATTERDSSQAKLLELAVNLCQPSEALGEALPYIHENY